VISTREAVPEDIPDIMAIERLSFASPWSESGFMNEIKKPYSISLVGVAEKHVVGYIIAWYVTDEIHIANLAVHPEYRCHGIAGILVNRVIGQCTRAVWIGLEVRRSNTAARALYGKLGFSEIGVRKGYYEAEGEDALIMARTLNGRED